MAGPTFIDPPVDISTGTTGSYTDIDVSGSVSGSATAAIIRVVSTGTTARGVFVRKNGSTDDGYSAALNFNGSATSEHFFVVVGLDGSKIFEMKIENADTDCYLYGYFESECVMNTNATDFSTGTTGSYVDVDISSYTSSDTAVAAIGYVIKTSTSASFTARPNGSTDDRVPSASTFLRNYWYILPVDGSEIFEQKISSTTVDLKVIGYLKSNFTGSTNATDVSLGSTGSWIDLTALSAGAVGGLYQVSNSGTANNFGLRANGSSTSQLATQSASGWDFVCIGCDGSQIVEGQIANTSVDFWQYGYFTATGASTTKYYIAIG